MDNAYVIFGIVLVGALIFDLGLLSKKHKEVTIRKALYQTAFWVGLALAFSGYIYYTNNKTVAFEYISAYLMEWSLSIDNIFVFILLFNYFRVKRANYARVLLVGILMAIFFRIIFISVGIVLVSRFYWILYIFGAFLVYTGIKMFVVKEHEDADPQNNIVYRALRRLIPITDVDAGGRYTTKIDGKRYFTSIFVVVIMLASTDIVFALDSIPAVFAISQNKVVIYTSNVFAVLGLRSLFFLLRSAVNKFDYLQQGIAVVLIFIGGKMLASYFDVHIPVSLSLLVILCCLGISIYLSILHNRRQLKKKFRK
jgi:tellurite resistance protein TerC